LRGWLKRFEAFLGRLQPSFFGAHHVEIIMLTIGKLAGRVGISTEALRYYEQEGLIVPDAKSEAGYRLYGPESVQRVRFIRQAQQCGFTLGEIRAMLALRAAHSACCGDVRRLAIEKKLQIEGKIKALKSMSKALDALISDCSEESHPIVDCPILAALGKPSVATSAG
jgi:DNA-binding transcriptional MerR regulator